MCNAKSWAAAILLFAAALPEAHAQHAINLTGTWTDMRGDKVVIAQSGNLISLTAPSGRVLSGTLSNNKLTVEGDFLGSDVSGAPADVQRQVTARHLKIIFVGTVEEGGNKIVGIETKPDELRWNGDHQITALAIGQGTTVTMTLAITGWALGLADNESS